MEFLKNVDIDENTIDLIVENNDFDVLTNFMNNEYNVLEIIKYFKGIGINNIENMLINRIDLFFNTKEFYEENFKKFKLERLVELINNDIANIDNCY